MSAARHLHPDQLRMFMPAHELVDPAKTASYHIDYEGDNYEDVKAMKIAEAKSGHHDNAWEFSRKAMTEGTTLRDSIAHEGVKTPVQLYHFPLGTGSSSYSGHGGEDLRPELGEGHHRVFTAADLNPKMEVPVRHYDYYDPTA